MKQKLIIAAIVVMTALTVLYGAGTTVNGTRVINGDLTVKGTCTGCSGGLTIGTTTVASGTSTYLLYNNAGTLGNIQVVPGTQGGGLVLVEQHTASNSASLNFTTCITSTYDDYVIKFVNIIPQTNSQQMGMRMSTDGGMNYDSGGNYATTLSIVEAGGATGTNVSNGGTSALIGPGQLNNGAGVSLGGSLELWGPGSSASWKQMFQSIATLDTRNTSQTMLTGGALYKITTAVNAFQFFMASGNLTSGTIRCYGVAK